MNKNRVCLFTAHSPLAGGGSAILKSLIENVPEISVCWYYLGSKSIIGREEEYLGRGIMNDGVKSILPTWRMLSGKPSTTINALVERLLAVDCDSYWIVSHNEGLRVALELAKRQVTRPVHLTFHDDWAGALCARSTRFRLMASPAQRSTALAINAVSSFDVISKGMQDYYKHLGGREGVICHRYVPASSITSRSQSDGPSNDKIITVGHIGSLYNTEDFVRFLNGLNAFVHSKGKILCFKMWGTRLNKSKVPAHLQNILALNSELPESQVIPKLANCDFVYAMYPMSKRLHCFSKTSLPTKLSSYVKAGRPILGHGPSDSSIAEFLGETGTGALWSDRNEKTLMHAVEKVLSQSSSRQTWDAARAKYFGENNLHTIRRTFLN